MGEKSKQIETHLMEFGGMISTLGDLQKAF
jgi:hypothetical protein